MKLLIEEKNIYIQEVKKALKESISIRDTVPDYIMLNNKIDNIWDQARDSGINEGVFLDILHEAIPKHAKKVRFYKFFRKAA
jgi:hypothetical protein